MTRKLTTASGRVFYVTAWNLQQALGRLYTSPDGLRGGTIRERVVKSEIDDGVREITMQEGPMKPAKGKR